MSYLRLLGGMKTLNVLLQGTFRSLLPAPEQCVLDLFGGYMKYILILAAFMLAACSSTGVVRMDSGTYMIAKRSVQVGFGPPDSVKADVYREANDFCAKQQKEVETINLEVTNSGFARPGNVFLQFRCK